MSSLLKKITSIMYICLEIKCFNIIITIFYCIIHASNNRRNTQ